MIDISSLPVVDVHCHPFVNEGVLTSERFTNLLSLGGACFFVPFTKSDAQIAAHFKRLWLEIT